MIFPSTSTDIPEDLLSAQEEGKVVFFCGAGISCDAGIPMFNGLLDETALGLKHELSDSEKRLRKLGKLDQLYQSFERDFGDPIRVRKVSAGILRPKGDVLANGVAKHRALLKLAKAGDGRTRIVTTNYDNLFDIAQSESASRVRSFAAPLLPVPKDYKWDGIVYLHGKLDDTPNDDNLLSLIVSSGDFGQAYLTERWAARFVSELFRDHVICFVGYSVNDVIMKYMMDALASEEMRGGNRNHVYAFAACKRNHEEECREEWKAKGITAIPYRTTSKKGYAELTSTLQEWARFHETGRIDKAAVVKRFLTLPPDTVSGDGRQDVERVLWALKDKVGATALPYPPTAATAQWLEYIPGDILKEKTGTQLVAWIGAHANYPESLQWCVRNERCCNLEQINELCRSVNGVNVVNRVLPELTIALVDACEILQSLNAQDFSYMHLPDLSSTDEHAYSKQDWYYLMVLLKHAMLNLATIDPRSAHMAWNGWCELRYPAFYRLILWAAVHLDVISAHEVIMWLRKNEAPIWIENSYREFLEFLDVKGAKAKSKDVEIMQRMLLQPGKCNSTREYEVATRLEHLKNGGAKLSCQAEDFLSRFATGHPDWQRRDRRWDGAYVCVDDLYEPEVGRYEVCVPQNVAEAKEYFKRRLSSANSQSFLEGIKDWLGKRPGESFRLLLDIGRQTDYWPDVVWNEAFSSLVAKDEIGAVIGVLTSEDVAAFSTELLKVVQIPFSFWAQAVSKSGL